MKPAGKFNSTNCDVELHVNNRTEIMELPEENSIPQKAQDFTKIKEILNVEQNRMVSAIVIVEDIQEEHQLTDKQGNPKKFRKVVVGDDTGSIVVTFWGEDTEKICFKPGDIILLSSMLVKDYQGKTLNCTKSSEVSFDIPNTKVYQDVLKLKQEGAEHRGQNISSAQQEQSELKMNLFTVS